MILSEPAKCIRKIRGIQAHINQNTSRSNQLIRFYKRIWKQCMRCYLYFDVINIFFVSVGEKRFEKAFCFEEHLIPKQSLANR